MASLDPGRTGGSGGRRPINAARKDTRLGARSVSAIGLPAGNRSAGNPIHRNNGTRSSSGTLAGPAHVPPRRCTPLHTNPAPLVTFGGPIPVTDSTHRTASTITSPGGNAARQADIAVGGGSRRVESEASVVSLAKGSTASARVFRRIRRKRLPDRLPRWGRLRFPEARNTAVQARWHSVPPRIRPASLRTKESTTGPMSKPERIASLPAPNRSLRHDCRPHRRAPSGANRAEIQTELCMEGS